jgi:hypothetical protein
MVCLPTRLSMGQHGYLFARHLHGSYVHEVDMADTPAMKNARCFMQKQLILWTLQDVLKPHLNESGSAFSSCDGCRILFDNDVGHTYLRHW